MKSAASLLSVLLMLVQPYTYAQTLGTPTPSPVPAPLSDTQNIDLSQATSTFQLEHTETQPVYTDEQVPSTCYNQVQQGTVQQCETLNDHECTTTLQTECTNVNNPVCQNVPTQVCQNVPTQQCKRSGLPTSASPTVQHRSTVYYRDRYGLPR